MLKNLKYSQPQQVEESIGSYTVKLYSLEQNGVEPQINRKELLKILLNLHGLKGTALPFFQAQLSSALEHRQIDLAYVFLKEMKGVFKSLREADFSRLSEFLLHKVLSPAVTAELTGVFEMNKVVEVGLGLLHKAWKKCLKCKDLEWTEGHATFRNKVVDTMDIVMEKFPRNSTFTALFVRLGSLALRYFVSDGDDFDYTSE